MKSIGTNIFYLFSDSYFKNLFELIKSNGFLILAYKDYKIRGGCIILIDKKNAYYHLSANLDKSIPGLTNSLLYKAMQHSSSINLSNFFLGGGNSNFKNNNLYKFKDKKANIKHQYHWKKNSQSRYLSIYCKNKNKFLI